MRKSKLVLKDLWEFIGCVFLGAVMAFGLVCLLLGIFYNAELQSISDNVDKPIERFLEKR